MYTSSALFSILQKTEASIKKKIEENQRCSNHIVFSHSKISFLFRRVLYLKTLVWTNSRHYARFYYLLAMYATYKVSAYYDFQSTVVEILIAINQPSAYCRIKCNVFEWMLKLHQIVIVFFWQDSFGFRSCCWVSMTSAYSL